MLDVDEQQFLKEDGAVLHEPRDLVLAGRSDARHVLMLCYMTLRRRVPATDTVVLRCWWSGAG